MEGEELEKTGQEATAQETILPAPGRSEHHGKQLARPEPSFQYSIQEGCILCEKTVYFLT